MVSMFSILLVAVLNMVPASVNSFTMEMPAGDTISFDRHKGGWNAVELPNVEMGLYYVSESQLGMVIAGKRTVQDLSEAINVGDWTAVEKIDLGGALLQIARLDAGFDITISEEGEKESNLFKIRWQAEEIEDPLVKLDEKILTGLSNEKWSETSRDQTAAFWVDFKKAHSSPPTNEYADFEGTYEGKDISMTVSRTAEGLFFVELDGESLPAVAADNSIIFTSGDITKSSTPSLGQKSYCYLQIFCISRQDNRFYFGPADMPPVSGTELLKKD